MIACAASPPDAAMAAATPPGPGLAPWPESWPMMASKRSTQPSWRSCGRRGTGGGVSRPWPSPPNLPHAAGRGERRAGEGAQMRPTTTVREVIVRACGREHARALAARSLRGAQEGAASLSLSHARPS
eukprot:7388707-Prymnesium_polylepis.1